MRRFRNLLERDAQLEARKTVSCAFSASAFLEASRKRAVCRKGACREGVFCVQVGVLWAGGVQVGGSYGACGVQYRQVGSSMGARNVPYMHVM